jgi:RNA polymerase sigma-70 factor (ECF subfamily)
LPQLAAVDGTPERGSARRRCRELDRPGVENEVARKAKVASAAAPREARSRSGSQGAIAAKESQPLTDQELIDGIRQASEFHFNELYSRYFQRIYNFVYGRIHNHADTEEIVQETFTVVFSSIGNYSGRSTLLSWVYGIAKNTANNILRQSKNQSRHLQELHPEQLRPSPAFSGSTPEERLTVYRYLMAVRGQLEELGEWQTEIFEMRHLQNLSIQQISTITDRSSDSIRSSLYRVKRLLVDAARVDSSPEI